MKVLVTYFSQTGNTKKIAEAIFDEIQTEKEIKPLKDVENLESYDFAFIGFPVHGFGPTKKAADFIKKEDKVRKEYILKHFHKDIDDPLNFHLVLNTHLLSIDEIAYIISDAVIKKFPNNFIHQN